MEVYLPCKHRRRFHYHNVAPIRNHLADFVEKYLNLGHRPFFNIFITLDFIGDITIQTHETKTLATRCDT